MTKSTLFVQLNTLDELTSEYRVADLRKIAKGKDTPAKTLALLAAHPDRGVREEVFANNNTPESLLAEAVVATIKFPWVMIIGSGDTLLLPMQLKLAATFPVSFKKSWLTIPL